MTGFVHLRLHTEYALTDGTVRVEPPKRKGGGQGDTLLTRAAALGFVAVAVTDPTNVYATVKFYKGAEAVGIKPVVGCDLWIAPELPTDAPSRLTVLVQNDTGFRNLSAMLSAAYIDGQSRGRACVSRARLQAHHQGLIALTGRDGALFRAAAADQVGPALAALDELQALFGDRLYLDICRCDRPGDEDWVQQAVALSKLRGVPVVATNDVRFLTRDDFESHEARVCIAEGRVLADPKRPRPYSPEQYLKSPEEMAERFADMPEALENSVHIARRCTLTLSFGTYHLPKFPVPDGGPPDAYLRARAEQGLAERFPDGLPQGRADEYRQRLDYELGIIEKMGFAGYFLVVADFIQWAKENGCPVGPGRGSGAGSLVAYAIRITDLDPLPFNLLFERFLNPERVSMPDFDIDFCMDNRDRVIQYVAERYGRDRVGQIITYSTMAARGVVRDVCRVLGHGYGFGDRLAKLIPGTPGATLADAMDEVPELKQAYAQDEEIRMVLDLALSLEGVTRGVGVHAGGVVIAPEPLTTYCPLYCEAGGGGLRTQFDMKDLETIGLVKFDFLGLKTLTVIEEAVQTIARSGTTLNVLEIPIDDAETYALYASGETSAVFQMESPGMQKAARDLKPDCFEDIVALVSLYRPGPMDLIPEYCARKRGDAPVEYLHPEMEPVLAPTYGIFVYQEQVMQMSQRMAGYTLGGADLLRRAMGKKKADEMATQRSIFEAGAEARGISGDIASGVFDLMEKFANYGFNKSHAAAYALVSYQTAWLKRHYPAEFMAAVLSCEMAHTETIVVMRDEALRMGLDLLSPDINRSEVRFSVAGPRQVRYGLGAIRGVGEGALESMLAARAAGGPFTDLFDFCHRIDLKRANRRVLEALIGSGSLDGLGLNRASLLATLPAAIGMAEQAANAADSGQVDLFGGGDAASVPVVSATEVDDFTERQRLDKERETLGFYLSGHPIDAYRDLVDKVCSGRLRALIAAQGVPPPPGPDGKTAWQPRTRVMFAAWVTDLRFFKGDASADGRGGRASYKVTLDDQGMQISVWVDAERWPAYQHRVKVDRLVFTVAELGYSPAREGREAEPRLFNPEFFTLDQVYADHAQRLTLHWRRPAGEVVALRRVLSDARDPAGVPVTVRLDLPVGQALLDLPREWHLRLTDALLQSLVTWLGDDALEISYRAYVAPVVEGRRQRNAHFVAADDEE
ncbi:MAG: DNA polymerase III subunit alpha [Polycyclovorans sp.]|nr:DNA polymerase III subunit alpha [Gammaproteobacteria bacterium]MDP1543224.1 DNA polymerase III subunit alpha [Polycyclovorans sp.]